MTDTINLDKLMDTNSTNQILKIVDLMSSDKLIGSTLDEESEIPDEDFTDERGFTKSKPTLQFLKFTHVILESY
jgi:hypothetical protein